MDRTWERIGRWTSAHSVVVLVAVAVVTAVLAVGAARLDFATGQDSYLDADSTAAVDNERYQDLFGGESMVVLFTMPAGTTVVDLLTPANVEQFAALDETLHRPDSGIEAVITPVTALQWSHDLVTSGTATGIITGALARETDPAGVAAREADAALTLARVAAAGAPDLSSPDWLRFLLFDNTGFALADDGTVTAPADEDLQIRSALLTFFPDATHALTVATVRGNASLDELATGSASVQDAVAAATFTGDAEVLVTGTPTFLTDINDYLQGGMLTLGAIALGVMVVLLLAVFHVRWRLLPLLAMVIGVVWGFGLFGFIGRDLSLVTIAGLPILIGIGVDLAIQVHNRVEEECVLDHDASPFAETMRQLGPPMVVATLSGVIAFLVMRISRVPMIRDFGVLLAIGITMLLVAGIVVPLAVLGARERRRPTEHVQTGLTERILNWLGSLPRGAVLPLIGIAVIIPVIGVTLETRSDIESDPINWADQSTATVRNARRLETDVNFATTLGVFIETDDHDANGVFTDQLAAFVNDFVERELAAEDELVQASSLVSTVASLIDVPGATPLPPTGADLLAAHEIAPPDIQRLLVGADGNTTQVLFQVGPSSLEGRSALIERMEASIADPGPDQALLPSNASATPGGLAVVGVGLYENLTANRAALTIVALVLVAAWLVLRYGDLVRAALTMIPVLLAVGASATLVALLGITLSPLTTVGGPLVVATCAEFSALLTARYTEGRVGGLTPQESQARASERTGRAFIASALTTIGGFAVLMFAALPLLRDFGAIVTLNIVVAVTSALVVVPPLAVWADERGWFRADQPTPRHLDLGPRRILAAGSGVVLAAVAVFMIVTGTRSDDDVIAEALTVPATDVPATLPPPTTVAPSTTTTEPAPGATTTAPAAPAETLPPGPPERPAGLVAGTFYDTLTGAGVDAGVARCAADELIATTPEAELLDRGIALVPRPADVDVLLADAALSCGVPQETLDQLAAG